MYNRYIPQSDGSYRKNAVSEAPPPKNNRPPSPAPPPQPELCAPAPPCHPKEEPIGGFLRQILPKNFDTGDLFIVLLLLLMAGDSEEGRANALLTLALYFIM